MNICVWIVLHKQLLLLWLSDDIVVTWSWVRYNGSSSKNKGWLSLKKRKVWVLLWLWCEDWQAAWSSEGQCINRFSMQRISIKCKEIENFSAVIEEGNYLLKSNRINVLSSCGKSFYHGEEKEIPLLWCFTITDALPNPLTMLN